MSEYTFTQDWFSHNIPVWEQLATLLPERKKFLEIGSFEGRSMVWAVENMLEDDGEIYCIDTW
jgi:predicted O-methyltransferase YrrM